jgi:hypothetical protein
MTDETKLEPMSPEVREKFVGGQFKCKDLGFNESVMALWVMMFEEGGRLRHDIDTGRPFSFDSIWTELLQMDDDEVPEGQNRARDIMRRRIRELMLESGMSFEEQKADMRSATKQLHGLFLPHGPHVRTAA